MIAGADSVVLPLGACNALPKHLSWREIVVISPLASAVPFFVPCMHVPSAQDSNLTLTATDSLQIYGAHVCALQLSKLRSLWPPRRQSVSSP